MQLSMHVFIQVSMQVGTQIRTRVDTQGATQIDQLCRQVAAQVGTVRRTGKTAVGDDNVDCECSQRSRATHCSPRRKDTAKLAHVRSCASLCKTYGGAALRVHLIEQLRQAERFTPIRCLYISMPCVRRQTLMLIGW